MSLCMCARNMQRGHTRTHSNKHTHIWKESAMLSLKEWKKATMCFCIYCLRLALVLLKYLFNHQKYVRRRATTTYVLFRYKWNLFLASFFIIHNPSWIYSRIYCSFFFLPPNSHAYMANSRNNKILRNSSQRNIFHAKWKKCTHIYVHILSNESAIIYLLYKSSLCLCHLGVMRDL